MKTAFWRAVVCALLIIPVGLLIAAKPDGGGSASDSGKEDAVAPSAAAVRPLLVGSAIPDVSAATIQGDDVSLSSVLNGTPTILVFYRGGWCMYCNRYFSEMRMVEDEIKGLGYQIVAIGADPPDATAASQEKTGYTLLSDADLEVARAFGIAFQMDESTIEKYRGYKIDLEHSAWRLPVPAVFIIDAEGMILFEHVDPDYSKRLPAELVLAAAKAFGD